MNCDQKTILNHLHSMKFARKLGVWMPHELSENNKENHFQIASQHLTCHQATRCHKQHFLYQIIMGDEKWCLYINMKQRKEWVAPGDMPKPRVKPDLHPRKTMICIWWDWEGMVHWEMLERNATVNKEVYIPQLHCMNEAIRLKRPHGQGQTILLHNNSRPHVAQVIKAALQELKWEVLQHPPYSPDFAPTDYYLFCSLLNHMWGVTFNNEEDLKNWLNKFFNTRPGDFWWNDIDKLVERWEEVVNSNGEYIIY